MSALEQQINKNSQKLSWASKMNLKCEVNYKDWKSKDEMNEFALKQFFTHMFKQSITDTPKEQYQKASDEDFIKDYYGWVHMCNLEFDEESMTHKKDPKERPKKAVRTLSTIWQTIKNDPNWLWICPNTFSTRLAYPIVKRDFKTNKIISSKGGRKKKYVRWINAIFIDVDNLEFATVDELIKVFTDANLPKPTVINQTKHNGVHSGYHVYWILDERIPGSPKVKDLYTDIMLSMQDALNKDYPLMDVQVKDVNRYMQVPHNIIYSDYGNMTSFKSFVNWMVERRKDQAKNVKPVNHLKAVETSPIEMNKDYQSFTSNVNVRTLDLIDRIYFNEVAKGQRHLACFTLSMFYKLVGYTKDKALATLLNWSNKHGYNTAASPYTDSEVQSTVIHVYDNQYPMGYMINNLKEVTGEKIVAFNHHALKREERKYSHYSEWINDIVTFLCDNQIGIINGSQVELADMFGVPLSSFKQIIKLLKKGEFSDLITLEVVGKGRYATTIIKLTAQTVKQYEKGDLDHFIAKLIFKNEFDNLNDYESDVDGEEDVGIRILNKASP